MTKPIIPSADFTTDLVQGKTVPAMTQAGADKGELWQVPVANICILEGFNVRVTDTSRAVEAHEELVNSIITNGFYGDKPLSGYVQKEGDDDVIYITDGHRRYAAVDAANEKLEASGMPQIEKLPVIVKPQTSTLEDLTVAMLQANSGEPLTMYEQAILVKRLFSYGMTKDEIANRLSKTPRHIDNLELIAGVPGPVRTLIVTEQVSATQALQEMRKNPAKAAQVLGDRVKAAAAKGKTKAAPKDSGPKMRTTRLEVKFAAGETMGAVLKTMAGELRQVIGHDADGDAITPAFGVINVMVSLPAPVDAVLKSKADKTKKTKPATPAADVSDL